MMKSDREIKTSSLEVNGGLSNYFLDVIIAITTLLSALMIFIMTFFILHSIQGERLTAFKEVADFIISVDVSAQQYAFRLDLMFFAAIWSGMYFFGDKIRRVAARLACPVVKLCSEYSDLLKKKFSREALRGMSKKEFHHYGNYLLKGLQAGLIISTLILMYYLLESFRYEPIYGPGKLGQITGSDPHSYQIFARSCEVMLGTITSNGDHEYYGLGASLLYCGLRRLGLSGAYSTQYQLIRIANFTTLIGFITSLSYYWRDIYLSQLWKRFLTIIALILVIKPLIIGDDNISFIANLSGLRYLPVISILLMACCTTWSVDKRFFFLRAFLAATGIALFPDTGLLGAIGCIVMEGACGNTRLNVIKLGALSSLFIGVLANLIEKIVSWLSAYQGISLSQLFLLTQSGFAGITVSWDGKMLLIASIAVVATTLLISSAGNVKKNDEAFKGALCQTDSIALATSVMIIFWIPYYLHRPFDYLIFSLLLMFSLSWIMKQTSRLAEGSFIIVAMTMISICLNIMLPSFTQLINELNEKKNNLQPAEIEPWSGIMLPRQIVEHMQRRLTELDKVRTQDSFVITGIPTAVAAKGGGFRAPIEAIFTLGQKNNLEALINRIQIEKPSSVILDGPDNMAWGAITISALVSRLEAGISSSYTKVESTKYWRVWKPSMTGPH